MVVVEFATMHGLAMTTVYMTTVYNDSEDLFLENRLLYLYEVQVASGCLEFLTRTSRRCRESGKEKGPVRRCSGGGGVAINSPSVA